MPIAELINEKEDSATTKNFIKNSIKTTAKYHLIICQGDKICRQYDCSFIGYNQYLEFLEDLKLIGDGQEVIKIKTKHEGE